MADWEFVQTQLIAFGLFFIYGSFFEWALHRFVMHSRWIIQYPYETHTLVHHHKFRADETFHAQDLNMLSDVGFSPKEYLFLLSFHIPLFFLFQWVTGIYIALGASLATLTYLAIFDLIHWRFHVPKEVWYTRTWPYKWIKRHHHLHHLHMNRNLNVVIPLADLVLGTLITKPRPPKKKAPKPEIASASTPR